MTSKILLESLKSLNRLKSFFFFSFSVFLISCSSNETKYIEMEDFGKNSKAPGAAYAADSMYIQPLMKSRADWEPQPFYFKECEEIGQKAHYSKTYYECSTWP